MEENAVTRSKYDDALAKYNTKISDEEIAKKVDNLIQTKVEANNTKKVKELLFHCIDLTTLK